MVDAAAQAPALLTFLIADVRGYTAFTLERGDEEASRLAARFADLAEETVTEGGGRIVELRGDEALAVFSSARQALRTAAELQSRFIHATETDPSLPLRAGIGLDAGEAVPTRGGYRGAALNLAARLCGLAAAGEVLASETVTNLARYTDGLRYADRGTAELKGFAEPIKVVQVLPDGTEPRPSQESEAETEGQILPIGGFLGSLPAGPIVARDEEIRRLLHEIDAAGDGQGRVVLLTGEPGIGKTRLAQEATSILHKRGFVIGSGRCYEPEQTVPYYPFRDALATVYSALPALQGDVPKRWTYLGQLLPDEIAPTPLRPGGDQEEQQRLLYAVAGFLQAATAIRPVALLLDDLHWADGSSLKLLQHIARHTRSDRILVLGTYRDVEVGRRHPLEGALRDLNREGLTAEITLRRLDKGGTAALAAATFDEAEISDEFADLIYRHTEGNPFFTSEVLHTLVDRGDLYRKDGAWERRTLQEIEVPKSVRSVVGERVSRLAPGTQELLTDAAVLGQSFDFDDLSALASREEEEIEAALDEAEEAGLVRPGARDTYGFSHALIQQVLYEEIPPRRRRRLHRAAGEALETERRHRRVTELAFHFLQGDDPDKALRYSLEAGKQAEEVFAHAEAETHLRTAIELAEELGDRAAEAEAREILGRALSSSGRGAEGIENLLSADNLYRDLGDREGRRRSVASALYFGVFFGEWDKAAERVPALLADREPSAALARIYTHLAQHHWILGEMDVSLALAEKSAEIARQAGDEWGQAAAEMRRGTILMQHDIGRGRDILEQAAALAHRAGHQDALVRALNNLGSSYWTEGEITRAMEYLRKALTEAERLADPLPIGFAYAMVAQGFHYLGDPDPAREHLARADAILRPLGPTWTWPYALIVGAMIAIASGEFDTAESSLHEAGSIAEDGHDAQAVAMIHRVSGDLDLLRGDSEAIVARFEQHPDLRGQYWPLLAGAIAEAYACLGMLDRADEMTTMVEVADEALITAYPLRVRALLKGKRGDFVGAEESFASAITLIRRMPFPLEELKTLRLWGDVLVDSGQKDAGEGRLREALTIAERIGAEGYARAIRSDLEALAVGPGVS